MVALYALSLAILALTGSTGPDVRSAFDDAWQTAPYLAPSRAFLVYVHMPVVFLASIYFWFPPGLALALRFASPTRFGQWIALSFVLAIPAQVIGEFIVKLLGFPVDRGAFLFVSFGVGLAAWAALWLRGSKPSPSMWWFSTQEPADCGANVTCLMRDWVPSSRLVSDGILERTNIVRGELEDHGLLVRVLNEYEIDFVFHLGAQTIVGTANRSALSTFEANVRGTWNLLEACKTNDRLIQRVVVASSDKAYGVHESLPYTEDAALQGTYPYDVSKSCADLISFSYFHSYGVPVAVTRCGNLIGGGDLNFNRLVPGTIRQALMGEAPIIRSDGRFVRDYFYVCDAVRAYWRLAEALPGKQFTGQAFNFGTETPVSVLELVDVILETMGRTDLTPIILNEASNEIPKQYLDCTKARRMLSWSPAYSLEDGLSETVSSYNKHLGYESAIAMRG